VSVVSGTRRHPVRTALVVTAIAVVGLLVVAGTVWGSVVLGTTLAKAVPHPLRSSSGSNATASGPRIGTHRASHPLHCDDACITTGSAVAGLVPTPGALRTIGAPELSDDGSGYDPGTPSSDYDDTLSQWTDADPQGDPDCMFVDAIVPFDTAAGAAPSNDGSSTRFLSEYDSEDTDTTLDLGVREFTGSADAEAYVAALQTLIAGCRHYSTAYDDGSGDRWDADVSALSRWGGLPDDVTALGWVETGSDGGEFYGIDLQRGDLVVRATISADSMREDTAQSFASSLAQQLEALPSDGSAPPNA